MTSWSPCVDGSLDSYNPAWTSKVPPRKSSRDMTIAWSLAPRRHDRSPDERHRRCPRRGIAFGRRTVRWILHSCRLFGSGSDVTQGRRRVARGARRERWRRDGFRGRQPARRAHRRDGAACRRQKRHATGALLIGGLDEATASSTDFGWQELLVEAMSYPTYARRVIATLGGMSSGTPGSTPTGPLVQTDLVR